MQPQAERVDYFQDRFEIGAMLSGERFVKTFARQAGITRLPHPCTDADAGLIRRLTLWLNGFKGPSLPFAVAIVEPNASLYRYVGP